MAISPFEFPGVTLNQIFESASAAGTASLGVLCIGPQYVDHNAETNPLAVQVTNGGIGSGAFTRTDSGIDVPDTTNKACGVIVTDGWFEYATLSGGSIGKCTPGANGAGTVVLNSQVTYSNGQSTESFGYGVAAGDKVLFTMSGASGATAMMDIMDITSGGYAVYGYNEAGSTDLPSGNVKQAVFMRSLDSHEQASGGAYTTTSALRTLVVSGAAVTVNKADLLGGVATGTATLYEGLVYADYKEQVTGGSASLIGTRGSVNSPSQVAAILGTPSDDNPLAAAVYCAAAEAGGNSVYFTAVPADVPSEYATALSALERYDDIYSVIAAKKETDQDYIETVQALNLEVIRESTNDESKVRRVQWFAISGEGETQSIALKNKLIHDKKAFSIANERSQCVFAENVTLAGLGTPVGNYAVAAAAAGLRSYQPVQRPLSNLPFNSFVINSNILSRSQQAEVACEGIWIVANNTNNVPVTLRQLTTAAAKDNINLNEESIVANADEIALSLCHVGEELVGCSNIHPQLLLTLENTISLRMSDKLLDDTGSVTIGPQLLDWELVSLEQDPVNLDHVNATITCTPPKPFNRFNITVRIL